MSKNTANVTINVINQAQSVNNPPLGIVYVMGETLFGIPNDPSEIITSIAQFEKLFGGITPDNDFPLLCEQAIKAGAKLRVCKVAGSSVFTTLAIKNTAAEDVFNVSPKVVPMHGTALTFSVKTYAPSNGNALSDGWFDLEIGVSYEDGNGDPVVITERYKNLKLVAPSTGPYHYLDEIIHSSKIANIEYLDLSSATANEIETSPNEYTTTVTSSPISITDYSGDQVNKTGVYAFDPYDDGMIIAAPAESESTLPSLYSALKNYAELRKDLIYFNVIDNSLSSASDITTFLESLVKSDYVGSFGGGLKVIDPLTGYIKEVNTLGEYLGIVAKIQSTKGPWISPTAYANGKYSQAVGVVNNFGSPASLADLDLISNAGGNMAISKGGYVMQWDYYSMGDSDSPLKFLTIPFLLIYMKRVLKPALETFLGKPNTPLTWASIYATVKPFLDSLVQREALYDYKWDGDQFATSLDNLTINDPEEISQGFYRVQLQIKAVVPMVEIVLNIVLSKVSVDFK